MSFDTEFDYSAASTALDARIAVQNTAITELDTKIADVTALPAAYTDVKTTKLADLNRDKDNETAIRDNAQSVKDEIIAVTGLSAGNKTLLYNFYILTGEDKRSFMQRMLFNHGNLVTDATALLADTDLNTQSKQEMAAQLICSKHPINRHTYMIFREL